MNVLIRLVAAVALVAVLGVSPGVAASTTRPIALNAGTIMIPSGDLISVQIQSNIGSRISVEGDSFAVLTVEDYYVKGKLVLPKGTAGYGSVTHIKRAGMFHSGGELTFVVKRLVAPGGTEIAVETNGATADADMKAEKNGNEVGQYLLFGFAGVFTHRGNDTLIKRGTMFHVATLQNRDAPVVAYGTEPRKVDANLVTRER